MALKQNKRDVKNQFWFKYPRGEETEAVHTISEGMELERRVVAWRGTMTWGIRRRAALFAQISGLRSASGASSGTTGLNSLSGEAERSKRRRGMSSSSLGGGKGPVRSRCSSEDKGNRPTQ